MWPDGLDGNQKEKLDRFFFFSTTAGCVTSVKWLYLSKPLIHHLKSGYYTHIYRNIIKIKWG